jgi:hypothetical protein
MGHDSLGSFQVQAGIFRYHGWHDHWLARGDPDGLDAFTPVLGTMMLSTPMPMTTALSRLGRAGFGRSRHGFAFGTTEERVAARVLAAVESGVLGMDFSRPFSQSLLGGPELTNASCQLSRLLAEWKRG